jgi:hypothetical protein
LSIIGLSSSASAEVKRNLPPQMTGAMFFFPRLSAG